MVQHIVMWNFNDSLSDEKKIEAGVKIKADLEALQQVVEGTISIEVRINDLESSNRDIILICKFDDIDALKRYQTSDGHVQAGKFVKQVTCDRACFDYTF